jgi:hypothetical protein
MAASSVERVLLIRILNVVISAVEGGDIAGVVKSVASYGELVIADYFAVSDISVLLDVF